ncbi:50S ribosomal protein L25/general stress protein Ctc [Candidatus Mesenet endosymbiont of Agriotes lineatus]|uniref:50S ribosomal protein L25/general stress protein Ctc n=1 Tax=Candidatus Mesenet endosymbiont of Agriotes lineatus TaxID=3077948 RepID=UPI0030CF9F07
MVQQEIAVINAQTRDDSLKGKQKIRRLRTQGKIPSVIYGKGRDSISLVLSMDEFVKKYRSGSLSGHLIKVSIDGKDEYALIREIQRHVVKDTVQHVDFQFVDTEKEIKVNTPLHFINESKCPGIKLGGALNILHRTITVKCFLQDIPEFIEVDLSGKMIGQSIHASEIKLPKNIKLALKEDDATILTISATDTDASKAEVTQQP